MSIRRLFAGAWLAAALACGRDYTHLVHGVVRELRDDDKQVVIEHEDIPGLMSAMTMSFDVPDAEVRRKLVVGEHVLFELDARGGHFRIVGVRGEGPQAGAVRSPSVASLATSGELAPDFSLVDQDGKRVSLADLRGRLALVDFIYTRCTGPCPILSAQHVELQRALSPELRERVRFVSISLDPEHDSPAVLAEYARARGADLSGWSFLTGPTREVAEVVRRFGVGSLRAADGSVDHVVAIFVLDSQGRIAKRWLGLEHTVAEKREQLAALAASS